MSNHAPRLEDALLTRREALCRAGMGFGALALSNLMAEAGLMATPARVASPSPLPARALNPLAARQPQFAPRVKRVIHLFMNGGPSQVDTFDPKPALTKYAGKALPSSLPTER